MKVLLLETIKNLGLKGEVKQVNDGYARNFLIPKKLAQVVSRQDIKDLENQLQGQKAKVDKQGQKTKSLLIKINNQKLVFKSEASEKGTLFKAVAKSDIIGKIKEQFNLNLQPGSLELEKPIKELGKTTITIKYQNESVNLIIEVLKNA